MKKTKVLLVRDNLMVGAVPAESPDAGAFLVSQEDTTFVGIILDGGATVYRTPFEIGGKIYFGKDYLQMNVEGVRVKIMPCSNVKAYVKDVEGEDE